MSATRGLNSEIRHDKDSYITPPWTIRRFLEAYTIPQGVICYDPCASKGQLIRAVRELRPDIRWLATEIDPNCAEELGKATGLPPEAVHADFLALPRPASPDSAIISISNPPYRFAQRFIEQNLAFTKIVAYLLRLNFLADGRGTRRGFAMKNRPGIFVLPNRPSFNGWGGDATEYAWFVFGDEAVAGQWFELGQTPEEEISAWNAYARGLYPEDNPKLREAT